MYIMGMEKILSRNYAIWKKSEKDKDDDKTNHRGPRKGLPVGLMMDWLPAMG